MVSKGMPALHFGLKSFILLYFFSGVLHHPTLRSVPIIGSCLGWATPCCKFVFTFWNLAMSSRVTTFERKCGSNRDWWRHIHPAAPHATAIDYGISNIYWVVGTNISSQYFTGTLYVALDHNRCSTTTFFHSAQRHSAITVTLNQCISTQLNTTHAT